ncbi:MAG: phage antirepressor KilAC domain-containing protein [Bordetella sp.]|uniref:phage antirepressor KilAC domain-containing protein n=1 Tax=Bordetella sp. TaxID=28081 RepID=UPI003F7B6DC4
MNAIAPYGTLVHVSRNGEPCTTSLQIARAFKRRHDNVLRSISSLLRDGTIGHLESEETEYQDAQGKAHPMYVLTETGALIAMPFIGGRHAREGQRRLVNEFQGMRRQLASIRSGEGVYVPQSLPDALRLAADLAESNTRLETTLRHQAPKAQAYERLTAAEGSMCITDAAKALNLPPRKLFAWLQTNKWVYRRAGGERLIAYQVAIMRGLLEHGARTIRLDDGGDRIVSQVLVTAKGLTELARRVEAGDILAADPHQHGGRQ